MAIFSKGTRLSQLLKFAGAILISLFCQHSFAGTITITCTDASDPNTCSSPNAPGVSDALITFVKQLDLEALKNSGICEKTGLTSSLCHLGDIQNPLDLACTASKISGVTCSMPADPNALLIHCPVNSTTSTTNSKTCNITTDRNLIPPELLKSHLGSFLNVFISVCDGEQKDSLLCQRLNDPSLTNQEKLDLLQAIQPLNPDTSIDVMTSNLKQALNTIQQRLSRIRTGVATNPAPQQQFFANGEWHNSGTLFADNTATANDASVTVDKNISEYGKLGVFVNVAFINAEQDNSSAELDSDSDTSTLTIGTDYRFTDQLVAGLAFNLNKSKTNFDESVTSGDLSSNGYSLLVYGSYYFNNWFIDSSITIGGDDYDLTRRPTISGVSHTYLASYYGQQISASGSVGYDFHIQSINISPFAQLIIGNVKTDQYNERKVNFASPDIALAMEEQSKDMLTLNLGSQINYVIATEKGVFIPSFSLTLVNDIENDAQMVTGHFVASPGSDFKLTTNEIDSSYFLIAAGCSFQLKGGNSGFLNIETLEGFNNLEQQRFTAGWRWEI